MRGSMKDHVREALVTVALFGSIGTAFAQSPAPSANDANNVQSAQSPKVPGHDGLEEPTVKSAPKPDAAAAVFVNGTLSVPNAPHDTATTPAGFSPQNDKLDHLPIMARGPQLSDAQRKLILERVMATPGAPLHLAGPSIAPTAVLPATVDMQAWPADLVGQVPDLGNTKYVRLPDKILVMQPDNSIVVEEIDR
jgi:hypothetical protein